MTDGSRVQADRLLSVLEPLPYPRRMRELADRAAVLDPAGARALFAELDARGPYERGLAVVVAAVTGDGGRLGERLVDPDAFVRGHVLRVATPSVVPDEAFAAALDDAPEIVRRELFAAIVAGGRSALADRLVDGVRADWGDEEAARLLPGCGPETVRRLLPELFHAVRGWTRLVKRHPEAVADAAERELAALPEGLRDDWWQRYLAALAVLAGAAPARVVGLLATYRPGVRPWRFDDVLRTLALGDPAGVLRLLLSDTGGMTSTVLHRPEAARRIARTAPRDQVFALGRALTDRPYELARLIAAHPPGRRAAFHEAVLEGRSGTRHLAGPEVLRVLPREAAAREARRVVAYCQGRPGRRERLLEAVACLPVAEAREPLLAATREPVLEEREAAWPRLIRNAARSGDPDAVTTVLADLARLRNEPDPVRCAALNALAALPPRLLTASAAAHLARVAADATQAPDLSAESRRALHALAEAVLREHPDEPALRDVALDVLVRLCRIAGAAGLGRLDHALRPGQEALLLAALRPLVEPAVAKADFGLVIALARALGPRAAALPEIQDLLWRAVQEGGDATARTAVGLWLAPAPERDARVERLLAHEPSAAVLPEVLHVLTGRRTDLLEPLLGDEPPHGRFLAAGRWTVPVTPEARRWTGRQQRAVVRRWQSVVADRSLSEYDRADGLRPLAGLPEGADAVLAGVGDPSVVVAEAALAALSHTVRPGDALPELLRHAGDDRARVAVYAADRATRHVPPSRLSALLPPLLAPAGTKVTSRKEGVRLVAARLPRPEAAALVAEAYERPDQHRDVRAVCVAAAARLFEQSRTRRLLTEAASGHTTQRRAVLRVVPAHLAEPFRPAYARLMEEVCDSDDDELVGDAYEALAAWLPWSPHATGILQAAVVDLGTEAGWYAATQGLARAACAIPAARNAYLETLDALLAADAAAAGGPLDAGTERDRPALQRLDTLVRTLYRQGEPLAPIRAVQAEAADRLAGHDATAATAAQLWAEALDLGAEPDVLHAALTRLARLHDARPMGLARSVRELARRLGGRQREGHEASLLAVARRLAATGGHAEGVLAVVLTAAGGERTDWAEPWRTLLRELRAHPQPEVRDEARGHRTAWAW
ncbi:hypothetical protein [Streptomyces solicathayae]|uniref:Large Pro/Ala/Gly-rich protein n=1 Tax=Streptomyces solicathayae TaxID=3081768 RepID=A0ABZ0LME7_9ACTN|nr:hypothetical protein [Streptomyces sp. HUAS YS2]WOX20657.1 hypothetical protein R2D22_04315 [Streptomyces sp. HUAS YS2]